MDRDGGYCASTVLTTPFRVDLHWQQCLVTLYHLFFSTRLACLLCFLSALAVALVAAVPEGMHNSRALSVSVSLFTTLRKRD